MQRKPLEWGSRERIREHFTIGFDIMCRIGCYNMLYSSTQTIKRTVLHYVRKMCIKRVAAGCFFEVMVRRRELVTDD